jgi:hypothetical protein
MRAQDLCSRSSIEVLASETELSASPIANLIGVLIAAQAGRRIVSPAAFLARQLK